MLLRYNESRAEACTNLIVCVGDRNLRLLLFSDLHIGTFFVLPADTEYAHMDFLRQGFRKLSSDRQTDRQTD